MEKNIAFPTVTIVCPVLNGWPHTKSWLRSIARLNYPARKIRVIVVDNGSTDHSAQRILKAFPRTTVVHNQTNLGFPQAINQAVDRATSELILITNNDIVYHPNCLMEMIQVHARSSATGAVGARVLWKDRHQPCIGGFRINPYLAFHQYDQSCQNRIRECDWISAHCLLISRQIFNRIGQMDEKFFFFFEDVDLSLRLRSAGFRLRYSPHAIAWHDYSPTLSAVWHHNHPKMHYLGYRSRWRCVLKHASGLQLLCSGLALMVIPIIQSLRTGHNLIGPMWTAFIDAAGDISNIWRWRHAKVNPSFSQSGCH